MEQIEQLARFSVMRASGFAVLAIVLVMMGTLHDPAASMRFGAAGFLLLATGLTLAGTLYPRRRRIDETEVWIMLSPEQRPPKDVARIAITRAMRAELFQKAMWACMCALGLLGVSLILILFWS